MAFNVALRNPGGGFNISLSTAVIPNPVVPAAGGGSLFTRPPRQAAGKKVRRRLRVRHITSVWQLGHVGRTVPVRAHVTGRIQARRATTGTAVAATRVTSPVSVRTWRYTDLAVDHATRTQIDAFHRERTPQQLRDEQAVLAAAVYRLARRAE